VRQHVVPDVLHSQRARHERLHTYIIGSLRNRQVSGRASLRPPATACAPQSATGRQLRTNDTQTNDISASERHKPAIRESAVKTMCNILAPFFKGRQRLRRCLYASIYPSQNILKLTEASVECRWRTKNWRLSTSIWSITAGSNVPSTLGRYASYCIDRR